jgi:hypothetical protein
MSLRFSCGQRFFDGAEYTVIDLLQISRGDPANAACSYAVYSFLFSDRELAEYY